jgi:hypothetical protein
MKEGIGFSMSRKSGGFLNLVALDAGSTNPYAFDGTLNARAHTLQVQVPAPLGYVMGVAHLIAELRAPAANITHFRHRDLTPSTVSVVLSLPYYESRWHNRAEAI